MSPIDAKNIASFKNNNNFPIVHYTLKEKGGSTHIFSYVFLENINPLQDPQDVELNATSIVNLERLGFVSIRFDQWYTTDSVYDKFKETLQYSILSQKYKALSDGYPQIILTKGTISITPLGKNFLEVCIK